MDNETKPNTFLLVALHPYRDVFKFTGRVARSTFWLHVVMSYIFSYAISTIVIQLFFDMEGFQEAAMMAETDPDLMFNMMTEFANAILPITALSTVAFVAWPSMLIRRMHDAGKSGWLAAPYLLLSLAGIAASAAFLPTFFQAIATKDTDTLSAFLIPFAVFSFVGFLVFVVTVIFAALKGQEGENRYGPVPHAAIN